MYIFVYVSICICARVYICIYIYVYIYVYTYIYTYEYTGAYPALTSISTTYCLMSALLIFLPLKNLHDVIFPFLYIYVHNQIDISYIHDSTPDKFARSQVSFFGSFDIHSSLCTNAVAMITGLPKFCGLFCKRMLPKNMALWRKRTWKLGRLLIVNNS